MRRIPLLCLLAALLIAPAASAASTTQILRDCQDDGVLEGHYTVAQMRTALKHLPTDVAEYSDCNDVLQRAIDAATAGGGPGGGGGPAATPTPSGGASTGGANGGGGAHHSRPAGHGSIDTPLSGADTLQDQAAVGDAIRHSRGQPVDVGGRRISPGRLVAALVPPTTLSVVLALLAATALAAGAPYVRRVLARRRS